VNETKATEFETALYASIEQIREEFKVMANALDLEKEQNKSNKESIKQLKDQVQSLQKDLELERPRYDGDSTRKLARDAFNQSTVSANWEGLENHHVIENLYKAIKDSRKNLGRSIQNNARRLDRAKPANEVFEELRNTDVITTIMARLADCDAFAQTLGNDVNNDRHQGNQQDLKLRDTLADHKTAINLLDFMLGESVEMFESAFLFSIGAFATMGYEKVGDGLREIIKKPKEKKK